MSGPVDPESTPPGWYPDPGNPAGRRYWDGEKWTEHVAVRTTAGPTQPSVQETAREYSRRWLALPSYGRAATWAALGLVVGLIVGLAAAPSDTDKLNRANAILRDRDKIVAEAKARNVELLAENQSMMDGRMAAVEAEGRARKRLARVKRQLRGASREVARRSFDGDGMFLVGDDIEAGTYKAAAYSDCYWARLSSGDTSDIIDNELGSGPMVLTVLASDYAVQVKGCGTFRRK